MPELAFVVPALQAGRVGDLAEALAAEISRQDAVGAVHAALPPPAPDRVAVGFNPAVLSRATAGGPQRSILILLDSPGGEAFEAALEPARRAGIVFHPNAVAVERLREEGVLARHLQLGYSSAWPGAERTERRVELTVVDAPDGYFDWIRTLRAIHRGSAVLHERSRGMAPLRAGEHLFVGSARALPSLSSLLSADSERLEAAHAAAVAYAREALPLELAGGALIGAARALVAQPLAAAASSTPGQQAPRSK